MGRGEWIKRRGGAWRGVRTLYWRAGEGREDMRGKGIERLIVGGRVWERQEKGEGALGYSLLCIIEKCV